MKTRLQLALFALEKPNWQVARECGIDETRLSRIASGRLPATTTEQEAIALALATKKPVLFDANGTARVSGSSRP